MRIKYFISLFCFIIFNNIPSNALPLDAGETIFSARCMACHRIDKDFTGPALMNIDKKQTLDWITKFVHSSQTVIKSGDTSAIALFSKFNSTVMPDQADLSDNDIKSIVAYIKKESLKVVIPIAHPLDRPYEFQPAYSPLTMHNRSFIIFFIVSVIMLILTLLFAVEAKQIERAMHAGK